MSGCFSDWAYCNCNIFLIGKIKRWSVSAWRYEIPPAASVFLSHVQTDLVHARGPELRMEINNSVLGNKSLNFTINIPCRWGMGAIVCLECDHLSNGLGTNSHLDVSINQTCSQYYNDLSSSKWPVWKISKIPLIMRKCLKCFCYLETNASDRLLVIWV